jgi:hypothetical protein
MRALRETAEPSLLCASPRKRDRPRFFHRKRERTPNRFPADRQRIELRYNIRVVGVLIKLSSITSFEVSTLSSAGLKKPVGLDLR